MPGWWDRSTILGQDSEGAHRKISQYKQLSTSELLPEQMSEYINLFKWMPCAYVQGTLSLWVVSCKSCLPPEFFILVGSLLPISRNAMAVKWKAIHTAFSQASSLTLVCLAEPSMPSEAFDIFEPRPPPSSMPERPASLPSQKDFSVDNRDASAVSQSLDSVKSMKGNPAILLHTQESSLRAKGSYLSQI